MGFYRGPNIVRDNLFLHLDAGSYRSYPGTGTTWIDLSGNGNSGTLVDSPTFSSGSQGHFAFVGTNDRVSFTDFTDIDLTDTTLSMWFKMDTLSYDAMLFSKGALTTSQPLVIWFDVTVSDADLGSGNTNTIDVLTYDGSVQHRVAAPTNTINSTTEIFCLDIVIKPSTNQIIIYVDGVDVANNTKTWNGIANNTLEYTLASVPANGTNMDGNIYNSKIYTKALSADEVLQNYNVLKGRYK